MTDKEIKRARIYRERNRILIAMGFDSYGDYLKSSLWADIRAAKLRIHPICEVCEIRSAVQVHHGQYRKKDLEGRDLRWLWSVCAPCHKRAEFRDRDGEKLTPHQATSKMRLMRTLRLKNPE